MPKRHKKGHGNVAFCSSVLSPARSSGDDDVNYTLWRVPGARNPARPA